MSARIIRIAELVDDTDESTLTVSYDGADDWTVKYNRQLNVKSADLLLFADHLREIVAAVEAETGDGKVSP